VSEPASAVLARATTTSAVLPRCSARVRPTALSPRLARNLIRACFDNTAVSAQLVDRASRVAGELVEISRRAAWTELTIIAESEADMLTVRVVEAGPRPRSVTGMAAAPGWDIVRRLATAYGYFSDASGNGVWAGFRRPGR